MEAFFMFVVVLVLAGTTITSLFLLGFMLGRMSEYERTEGRLNRIRLIGHEVRQENAAMMNQVRDAVEREFRRRREQ